MFHFQSRSKRKLSQKFKICVNRPILQIKIEKETYFWDFCKCKCVTFVNKGELSKLKGCIWRPYCFSSFREETNNGNNDKQCCVNVSADRWKDSLWAGRESYGHTVQSVAARSIVHKFLKRSPAWTKPERVSMGLLGALHLASIS